MANKKKTRKQVEEVAYKQETVIDEIKPVLDDKPIAEDTVEYEVVLATSSYFIVNKNGLNVVINKRNNYKKGDIVTL